MEMSWIAILFVWIVNRQRFWILIIISILPLRLISSCLIGYYKNVDGTCVECSPGTLGWNCSETCPKDTYGLKCAYICTCMDCNPVTGCLTQDTTYKYFDDSAGWETLLVPATDVPPTEGPVHVFFFLVLLIIILTIVGCNFAASMSLLWRFSTKFHLPQLQDKTPKEPTTRGTIEEIEMSPDTFESPIIPTERQDVRVYMELN